MKKAIKLVFTEFFLIYTLVSLGIALMSLISNTHFDWPWYMPFEILGVSISTSLSTLVHLSKKELSKNEVIIRNILHVVILLAIVFPFGYLFKWWSNWEGAIFVGCIFLFVYVLVFVIIYFIEKKESNKINKALKNLPKDEE